MMSKLNDGSLDEVKLSLRLALLFDNGLEPKKKWTILAYNAFFHVYENCTVSDSMKKHHYPSARPSRQLRMQQVRAKSFDERVLEESELTDLGFVVGNFGKRCFIKRHAVLCHVGPNAGAHEMFSRCSTLHRPATASASSGGAPKHANLIPKRCQKIWVFKGCPS